MNEQKMMRKITIFLIIIPAIITNICAMEKKETRYTVGIKIPNKTYAKKPINPIHMTITYLGEADEEKLAEAKAILEIINKLRPIYITVGEPAIFGNQENPIPVMQLLVENPKIEELLIKMHEKLGVCEPSQKEKFEIPSWHVSVKDSQLQQEFLELQGNSILAGKLFIKPLGNCRPIVEIE